MTIFLFAHDNFFVKLYGKTELKRKTHAASGNWSPGGAADGGAPRDQRSGVVSLSIIKK